MHTELDIRLTMNEFLILLVIQNWQRLVEQHLLILKPALEIESNMQFYQTRSRFIKKNKAKTLRVGFEPTKLCDNLLHSTELRRTGGEK